MYRFHVSIYESLPRESLEDHYGENYYDPHIYGWTFPYGGYVLLNILLESSLKFLSV